MPTKNIHTYEVQFTGEPLEGTELWGAYVSIFAPSDNPMHMTSIYAKKRVSADLELVDQQKAEAAAESSAYQILKELQL